MEAYYPSSAKDVIKYLRGINVNVSPLWLMSAVFFSVIIHFFFLRLMKGRNCVLSNLLATLFSPDQCHWPFVLHRTMQPQSYYL